MAIDYPFFAPLDSRRLYQPPRPRGGHLSLRGCDDGFAVLSVVEKLNLINQNLRHNISRAISESPACSQTVRATLVSGPTAASCSGSFRGLALENWAIFSA